MLARHLKILIIATIVVLAFLSRLIPLSMSQYPFNNDGLTECELATTIINEDRLPYSNMDENGVTHSSATPAMNLLLGLEASALGTGTLECAQFTIAVFSVFTVLGIYVLGTTISGSYRGGLMASFASALLGTFVFTTASVWKESLGIGLFVLAILCFAWRGRSGFRLLAFLILIILSLVHHLVAVFAFVSLAFPVVWSWLAAFQTGTLGRRHAKDLLTVVIPPLWAVLYYSMVEFDRLSTFATAVEIALAASAFVLFSGLCVLVLLMKKHSRITFSPVPGIAIAVLVLLDYQGHLFPYQETVSDSFVILLACFAFLVMVAWYGAEMVIETVPLYRALFLGLLLPVLVVMGFAISSGISTSSHQMVYRSFDLADIFLFIGAGMAITSLSRKRSRFYKPVALSLVVALVVSFPFAYASQDLLGVRHDTQAYEVDAVNWLSLRQGFPQVSSDERISHIGQAMADIPKDATLPKHLLNLDTIPRDWYGAVEDEWLTKGVNSYPDGLTVVPSSNYEKVISSSDVVYVGGPSDNRIVVFRTSAIRGVSDL